MARRKKKSEPQKAKRGPKSKISSPQKRGGSPKKLQITSPNKKGRPPKKLSEKTNVVDSNSKQEISSPQKRGGSPKKLQITSPNKKERPPKKLSKTTNAVDSNSKQKISSPKKRGGSPKKLQITSPNKRVRQPEKLSETTNAVDSNSKQQISNPKKRGRPPKNLQTTSSKKRGRPPKKLTKTANVVGLNIIQEGNEVRRGRKRSLSKEVSQGQEAVLTKIPKISNVKLKDEESDVQDINCDNGAEPDSQMVSIPLENDGTDGFIMDPLKDVQVKRCDSLLLKYEVKEEYEEIRDSIYDAECETSVDPLACGLQEYEEIRDCIYDVECETTSVDPLASGPQEYEETKYYSNDVESETVSVEPSTSGLQGPTNEDHVESWEDPCQNTPEQKPINIKYEIIRENKYVDRITHMIAKGPITRIALNDSLLMSIVRSFCKRKKNEKYIYNLMMIGCSFLKKAKEKDCSINQLSDCLFPSKIHLITETIKSMCQFDENTLVSVPSMLHRLSQFWHVTIHEAMQNVVFSRLPSKDRKQKFMNIAFTLFSILETINTSGYTTKNNDDVCNVSGILSSFGDSSHGNMIADSPLSLFDCTLDSDTAESVISSEDSLNLLCNDDVHSLKSHVPLKKEPQKRWTAEQKRIVTEFRDFIVNGSNPRRKLCCES